MDCIECVCLITPLIRAAQYIVSLSRYEYVHYEYRKGNNANDIHFPHASCPQSQQQLHLSQWTQTFLPLPLMYS